MPRHRLFAVFALVVAGALAIGVARADGGSGSGMVQMASSNESGSDSDGDLLDPDQVPAGKIGLVTFDNSPFPYHGTIPNEGDGDDTLFLDARDGSRRGHTSPRGGVYWENETYSDRRSLLYIPEGFDIRKPAAIIVYFHGNLALLGRDVVDRQQVPRQLAESGLNAVLVAPQFARDALDSSAGTFWQPGAFARFLREAADRLAKLQGDRSSRGAFAKLPVILVAYSGGYLPAAWSLQVGGIGSRLRGVVLLDALYDNADDFADWLSDHQSSAFFFSAFSTSSADGNGALQDMLLKQGGDFTSDPPDCLHAGDVVFLDTGDRASHNDYVSHAWTDDPLTWLFNRIPEFPRDGNAKACKH
jgi:hypothetical protein